ncbi:MAG TPA: hypothetical protein VJC17_03755 [Candidatus Dojkabacteria bacterium]|nr:hypothetical protein [Candidatus Dojkabacteria bacterium]
MGGLSTRKRITVVTLILTVAFVALQGADFRQILNFNYNFDPIKPLILAMLVYIGTYWIVFFKIKGERYLTVLFFPALAVFAFSLFAEILLVSILPGIGQLSLLVISGLTFLVFTYICLLTVNILNADYLSNIPLGQAARASLFVLTLFVAYIIFFLLFSNDIFIVLRLSLIFLIGLGLVYISLWTIALPKQQRLTVSLLIGLLLTWIGFVLSIWPVEPPYLALGLTMILYICLGIALEIRDIINNWIWIEYSILFFLIILLFLLSAEWGINGNII